MPYTLGRYVLNVLYCNIFVQMSLFILFVYENSSWDADFRIPNFQTALAFCNHSLDIHEPEITLLLATISQYLSKTSCQTFGPSHLATLIDMSNAALQASMWPHFLNLLKVRNTENPSSWNNFLVVAGNNTERHI